MAGYSTYPIAFDATFPGFPYVDNTEFVDQTQANAWVSAIQNIETTIGYGGVGNPAAPLYSAAYSATYASLTARIVATEQRVLNAATINSSNGNIQPVGVANLAGSTGLAADAGHVHASSASPSAYVPIGGTIIWPGPSSTFPSGFFLCNGQLVSISTYTALYTALGSGSVYGISGGSFFLPSFNDRYPVGVNSTAAAVGATGGSRTLTANQLPPHNHPVNINDPSHSHPAYLGAPQGPNYQLVFTSPVVQANQLGTGTGAQVSYGNLGAEPVVQPAYTGISASTNNTGAGFNYDQPFIGVYWLIRAL